jgi:PqqD family protein of HPr-rel-A system
MDPLARLKALAVSDTGFVFDPTTGATFTLNETGQEVIRLLKEGLSRYRIREKLLQEYDCREDQLDRDLDYFFAQLSGHGLYQGEQRES